MLKNGSKAFDIWKLPTNYSKVFRKYYLFSIQNPEELKSGKAEKPVVLEKGPYVYSEILEKKDVSFLNDEVIRYAPVTTLTFEESLSAGK